jgi:hypothetical protein
MCLASLLPTAMDALWHNMVVEEIAMFHINVTITYHSHAGIRHPGTFQLSSRSLNFPAANFQALQINRNR